MTPRGWRNAIADTARAEMQGLRELDGSLTVGGVTLAVTSVMRKVINIRGERVQHANEPPLLDEAASESVITLCDALLHIGTALLRYMRTRPVDEWPDSYVATGVRALHDLTRGACDCEASPLRRMLRVSLRNINMTDVAELRSTLDRLQDLAEALSGAERLLASEVQASTWRATEGVGSRDHALAQPSVASVAQQLAEYARETLRHMLPICVSVRDIRSEVLQDMSTTRTTLRITVELGGP